MTWFTQLFQAFAKPFRWWVIVAPWERGVRVRMGKTATELCPGPHLRIPFLDRIYVQTVRLRTISTSHLTLTARSDVNIILSYSVNFAIKDIVALYDSVQNPEETLRAFVSGTITACVAQQNITSVDELIRTVESVVNERLKDFTSWGLSDLSCYITGFVKARVYRLLNNDYPTGAGLLNIEKEDAGEK